VKKLTTERIIELKKLIMEDQQEYAKLKEEIIFLQDPNADENRVRAMALEIDQEKVKKEQEQVRYDQWLQERKEKQAEMERQWRPNWRNPKTTPKSASESENEQLLQLQTTPTTPGTSSASPLLTSLLKSSNSESSPTRSAPTITNLLTTGSTTPLMSQISSSIINASPQILVQSNANINHSASQIPVSLTAPTLITLLDKKPQTSTSSVVDKQNNLQSSDGKDSNDPKDDDADLLADFNELIPDKFDDEDLADINAIIMNPEILDDKIVEDEQSKDEDSSQAATTDDYDKISQQLNLWLIKKCQQN
jgi:bromodomain-containing protein 8